MSKTISFTELERNLAEYLDRVSSNGESFVVQREGQAVAELRPTPRGVRGADFIARFPGLPHLTPAEADDFARDIESARSELGQVPQRSCWGPDAQEPR
jgi:antitoxin (DNA-binding transcriptional repressor) of toxin-antitoxin stability system